MNTENNIHIIPSQEYACLLAHLPLGIRLPVSTPPVSCFATHIPKKPTIMR